MTETYNLILRAVSYLIEGALFCCLLRIFPCRQISKPLRLIIYSLFLLVYTGSRFYYHDAFILFTVTALLLSFGMCRISCAGHWRNELFVCIVFIITVDMGKVLIFSCMALTLIQESSFWLSHELLLGTALEGLYAVIKLAGVWWLKRQFAQIIDQPFSLGIVVSMLFPLMMFLFTRYVIIYEFIKLPDIGRRLIAIMIIFLSAGTFLSLFAWIYYVAYRKQQLQTTRIENLMQAQLKIFKQKSDADIDIHRMYHDIQNHLSSIEWLSGADKEVSEHIREIQNEIKPFNKVAYTGNRMLDAVINEKVLIALKEDIDIQILMDFSKGSFIKNIDICSIFGNALDNALEAASLVPDKDNRWIRLKAACKERILIVKMENSYCGERNKHYGRFLTTKAESSLHGIGMSSIEYSLNKYNGKMTVEAADGTFTLKMMVPLPEG